MDSNKGMNYLRFIEHLPCSIASLLEFHPFASSIGPAAYLFHVKHVHSKDDTFQA